MSTWPTSVAVASTYDDDGSETWHKLSITVIFSRHILNYCYYRTYRRVQRKMWVITDRCGSCSCWCLVAESLLSFLSCFHLKNQDQSSRKAAVAWGALAGKASTSTNHTEALTADGFNILTWLSNTFFQCHSFRSRSDKQRWLCMVHQATSPYLQEQSLHGSLLYDFREGGCFFSTSF